MQLFMQLQSRPSVTDNGGFERLRGKKSYVKNFRRMCWHQLWKIEVEAVKADTDYWDARYKLIAAPRAEGYVEVECLLKAKSQKSIKRYFAKCRIFSLDRLSQPPELMQLTAAGRAKRTSLE